MAGSTLDPDNFPVSDNTRKVPKGHDTASLGPSDLSDSGSDMAGPGLTDDDQLGLDRGTNEDTEAGPHNVADAGPSVGDLNMDDNSDSVGTGEHLTAGVVGTEEAGLGRGLDQAEEARLGKTDEQIAREQQNRPRRSGNPKA
jgi:hypothetical protein